MMGAVVKQARIMDEDVRVVGRCGGVQWCGIFFLENCSWLFTE